MGVGRQAALAGLAVLAGAALVSCTAGQARPRHGATPATSDGPGVIAHGWIDGRGWRITVDSKKPGRLCAGEAGLPHACTGLRGLERGEGPADLSGAEVAVRLRHSWASSGPPIWNALYGSVGPDVTLIVIRMSGGREISLRPVATAGKRWVGLVAPPGRAGRGQGHRLLGPGPSWGTRPRSMAGT